MMEHNHLAEWMEEIRRGKALASMVKQATVKDASGTVLELDRIQPDGSISDAPADDEAAAPADKADEPADEADKAKADEAKADEAKVDEPKAKAKADEPKAKADEPKSDEPKAKAKSRASAKK